jgi:hypothetical protein
VALNGTRSLLRDQTWRPQRYTVRVSFGAAISSTGPGWGHALELRDTARKAIAAKLSEPAINA